MSKRHIFHQGDDAFAVASMVKYYRHKQEMDKLLEKLIYSLIRKKKLDILDAGCGVGHCIFFLNKLSPDSHFVGVDQTPVYIKAAKRLFGKVPNFSFNVGEVEDLPERYPKRFDISISRAVISWMPQYEEFVKALFTLTKKHIFISSLFYEGDIDFITTVRMYKGESGRSDIRADECRNVYSLPRFKKFVRDLGAKKVHVTHFEMPIDLPHQSIHKMHTFTEKLSNGRRLQIAGSVLMNWKWIRIDL